MTYQSSSGAIMGGRRLSEDRLNEVVRHCRIGKITMKNRMPITIVHKPLKPIWIGEDTDWKQTFMGKCGCRVGSACGNVACPHRLVVT